MTALHILLALLALGAPQDPEIDLRRLPGENTPFVIGISVLDVIAIDDARQAAFMDFVVRLDWHDPRLAGRFDRLTQLETSTVRVPQVVFRNDRSLRRSLPEVVAVTPEGNVRYVQRFTGEISIKLDLSEFPWDRETLRIEVIVPTFPGEAVFTLDEQFSSIYPELTIANWIVGEPSFEVMEGSPFAESHYTLVYEQPIERRPDYYIWSVIVPLLFVVAMSWIAFWIDPEHVEAQLAVAATSMLSLVAFRLAVAQLVPPLSYFTRLDVFTIGATTLVFLALVEVGTTSFLQQKGSHDVAVRMDTHARWVLPLLLSVLLFVAFRL